MVPDLWVSYYCVALKSEQRHLKCRIDYATRNTTTSNHNRSYACERFKRVRNTIVYWSTTRRRRDVSTFVPQPYRLGRCESLMAKVLSAR